MKRTHLLVTMAIMVMAVTNSYAQGPNDSGTYYQAADGKKGEELKSTLFTIIKKNHIKLSYDDLWGYYMTTDIKSNGKIWDMYSIKTEYTPVTKGSNYPSEGSGYNREHSFPNSWFGGQKNHIAYSDLFHLYPTDGYVNNARSNHPFGENNGESYTSYSGFSKRGACTYEGYTGTTFEPNNLYKGDFARTYFYMVTRYEDELGNWYEHYGTNAEKGAETQKAVLATLDGNTYPGLTTWQLSMLMEWAKNDPVSEDKEIPRNIAVFGIQSNRNPFIDYPGLEEYIWGTMKDVAFSYDHYQNPTEIITVTAAPSYEDNVMYNMSGQVVDKSYKGLVIMNGKKFFNRQTKK